MIEKDFYEHNGFKYEVEYKTYTEKDKIKVDHNIVYPKKLFKYYSISEYSIDSFINSYLYASHPIELNDVLDCSPFLWYTEHPLDYKLYESLYQDSLSQKDLKELYDNDIKRDRCNTYIGTYWEILSNMYGIISMTGKESHPLMWPHYTKEKGFKIKFDLEKLQNSLKKGAELDGSLMGLFPMNYSNELKPIDISPYLQMLVPFFYSATIKDIEWQYEDEWRFIYSKPQMGVPNRKMGLTNNRVDYPGIPGNRKAKYDSNLVEEIMFGFDFFNGEDFFIKWNKAHTKFSISPKKNKKEIIMLLDYICDNLSNKLFYSGVKYEFNDDKKLQLYRTKEKLKIKKISIQKYELERTNVFEILN
ncbi:DUF2971 domain-containing protein [uncultured Algibacter sp.]|uniref:DUF2971 domain-containing protein n=1 Tax=uncultured Algibacter sp. TaxID=298659 RepID=UPI0026359784|nr:DUF2971 domain-containing protein [uncultured Algibacter sp.]